MRPDAASLKYNMRILNAQLTKLFYPDLHQEFFTRPKSRTKLFLNFVCKDFFKKLKRSLNWPSFTEWGEKYFTLTFSLHEDFECCGQMFYSFQASFINDKRFQVSLTENQCSHYPEPSNMICTVQLIWLVSISWNY